MGTGTVKWVFVEKGNVEGYTAAWVAKRMLKDGANIIFIGQGESVPDVADNNVLCFGISFPRAITISMIKKADEILFFDNDAKMREQLSGIKQVKINFRHTPARMAWEHLRADFRVKVGPNKKSEFHFNTAPWLVDYSENKELWKWPNVNKVFVKSAIDAHYQQALESWDELASRDLGAIEQEGMEVIKNRNSKPEEKKEDGTNTEGPEQALRTRKSVKADSRKGD